MKRFLQITALVTFTLALSSMAQAQATRTWVSGVGDDANPCSRTAPCKTFAGAISKTAACGEIDALDPGGYGAVTITKSITIDGTGTFASILASLTNGVIINAAATDVVTLRAISINGACNGLDGVRVLQAKRVNLEDMVIFRFSGDGIEGTDSDGVNVNIRNTVIRDNTEDGIEANSTNNAAAQEWTVESSSFNGNGNGIHARNNTRFNIRESVFADNTGDGIQAEAPTAGAFAVVNVSDSQLTMNNSDGIQCGNAANAGSSFCRISNNQITNNAGIGANETTGGNIETFSNNFITGNGTNGCTGCNPIGPGN